MLRPTKVELQTALAQAQCMRDQNEDPEFVAKSLLSLNERMRVMEEVLRKTRLYLRSGQGAREHTSLKIAVNKAEEIERPIDAEPLHLI